MHSAEGFPPAPGSSPGKTRGAWVVPTLVVVIGLLLITSVGMVWLWANARTELRKMTAAAQTVAAVGDSMIADLRSQVADLQAQVTDVQARAAGLNSQMLRLQAEKRARDEALDWCESLIDYVNNNAFYTGITYVADEFYRRANKCLKPTGIFYR